MSLGFESQLKTLALIVDGIIFQRLLVDAIDLAAVIYHYSPFCDATPYYESSSERHSLKIDLC